MINHNDDLRAPLVLYSVITKRDGILRRCLMGASDVQDIIDVLDALSARDLTKILGDENARVPKDYLDVYATYLGILKTRAEESEAKKALAGETQALLAEYGISISRLCRDLNLDYGNTHKWLHGKSVKHLSYDKALAIYDYVSTLKPSERKGEMNDNRNYRPSGIRFNI